MTKKFILFSILLSIVLINPIILFAEDDYTISASDLVAESAILIDQDTGQILFSKNPHVPMYPASTTKILTAIIVLEDMDLTQEVTITKDMEGVDGSGIALEAGEVLTVDQLLHAMLMVSANDAAEALAKTHSGTIEAFAQVMNERAAAMGALNSNFQNPHGLPNPDHLTTAYDLSLIAKYAMTNETFRQIVMTPRYEIPANAVKDEARILNHSNKFIPGVPGSSDRMDYRGGTITKGYDLITGIKSGYTTKALHCFVGAAELDGRRFISVIIKSQGVNMYLDTRKLLDYGLYGTTTYALYDEGETVTQRALEDKRNTNVILVTKTPLSVDLPASESVTDLTRQETIRDDITLPVEKGEVLGNLAYYKGETLLCETDLIAADTYLGEDLLTKETTFFDKEGNSFFTVKNMAFLSLKVFLALILWRTVMTVIRLVKLRNARVKALKERRRQLAKKRSLNS